MQINKIENKCTIVKINKTKSCFFKKDKPYLDRRRKKRNDANYQIAEENYIPQRH